MAARSGRGQGLLLPAVGAGLALVLLAALAVAALRSPTASAATVLLRGADVVAVLPDGARQRLDVGEEVPRGAVVRPGRDGAVLRTRDRDTWLSADAQLQVVDGARQELRAGLAMVDARRGPELELATAAATVTVPEGAVSRVERSAVLRVGAYAGDERVQVRAAGRRATAEVGRSWQVQVPVGGLPGDVTPLVLTPGDPYERALATDLVMADEALTDVARQLDAGGRPQTVVVAALADDVPAVPAVSPVPVGRAPGSERSLAYLLARASGQPVPSAYAEVRALRSAGGSWGVVADLVDAPVERVAGLLDELLGTPVVLTAEEVDVVDLLTPDAPAPGVAPRARPAEEPAPPAAQPPPAPAPPSEPPPSTGSPTPPPDVLDEVVETVIDLLPLEPASEPVTEPLSGSPEDDEAPLLPLPAGGLLP